MYLKKRIKDYKNTWKRMFFGSWEDFATILDYKQVGGQLEPKLEGKNIPRISRKYTENLKDGLKEMNFISNNLSKKYKQEILDSPELYKFLEDLLEIGDWTNYTNVDNYPMASYLFNISLEVLIRKAPDSLRIELIESIKRFVRLNRLPLEMGNKKIPYVELPRFMQNMNS